MKKIHCCPPEEEVPGHIPGIGKPCLSDLGPDGVDDCRLLLVHEQMADGASHDELLEEHNEVLLQELLLMEEQEDLLSLQRMRTQNRIPVLISQTI